MKRMTLWKVCLGAVALGATQAWANIDTYTLSQGNAALLAVSPGPYGEVTVNQLSATKAQFTFTAYAGFTLVDSKLAAVAVNATDFTIDNITATPVTGGDFGTTTYTGVVNPSGNTDGWGYFNAVVNADIGAFSTSIQSIDFTINAVGTSWGSVADVLGLSTGGGGGYPLAAHFAVCDGDACTLANGVVTAEGSDGTGWATVPIPAAAWLFGSALLGMVGVGSRRRFAA